MPGYHIWTIGCQMNQAESERLGSLFAGLGYPPAETAEEASLIVLNSCVVRQNAENKVVNKLNALRHRKRTDPGLTLAVTGCLVNSDPSHLKARFPYVDHFFPPGGYPPWLERTAPGLMLPRCPAPSTFVPIIQGCDNFCAYCVVPYRRGREKSRPIAQIKGEVKELVRRGTREVTLLGQNVDSYGHDLPDRPDLAELLLELDQIEGLARLRFLTNHPKDMSSRLIEAVARLEKVCEQISLPVQSGSNDMLKAMNRGYTVEHYRRLVAEIRRKIPQIALSTDVIVGFPGESEACFRQTLSLLAEVGFDTVHVAVYSPRPGTAAAREFEDDISATAKKRRRDQIETLQEKIARQINAKLWGRTVEVLVEDYKKGKWQGRTRSGKLVFFSSNANCRGQLIKIKIDKTTAWSLQGKVEPK